MKKIVFPLSYYKYPNFGDLLNELVLESLFPVRVKPEPFSSARMIGLGSLLDRLLDHGKISQKDEKVRAQALADRTIHIWGTGLMYRYDAAQQKAVRPMAVHALRGELTRAQLSEILGRPLECVLADPGLLASRVVAPADKRYDMGIIPHYVDADDPCVAALRERYENALVINVQDPPAVVLRQISQCRRTISTSLHGVIVSDAYNVPSCWCEISDKVLGGGFKFHDYFSSFGTDREPFDLRSGAFPDPERDFSTSFSDYAQVEKKQDELIRCFPRSLLMLAFAQTVKRKLTNK